MELWIFLGVAILDILIGIAILDCYAKGKDPIMWVILFAVASIVGCGLLAFGAKTHADDPTALDVYRGNTTLRVDYSIIGGDTIQGDTTVMYKSQIIKFEVE